MTEIQASVIIAKLTTQESIGRSDPDRIVRRRGWDLTGQLPPWARKAFTHGQKVILAWIGKQLKEKGVCIFSNSYIACAVSYGVTVVKQAKRIAVRLGLIEIDPARWISPTRRAICVIRKKCSQWLSWLDRGPTADVGTKATRNLIIESNPLSFFVRPAPAGHRSGP